MQLIKRSALNELLSVYQRDLLRAMLPVVAMDGLLIIGLFIGYVNFADQLFATSKTWAGFALLAVVIVSSQIVIVYLMRSVRRLSAVHGLVCPNCGKALGLGYTTLKNTGTCRFCKAHIVEEDSRSVN